MKSKMEALGDAGCAFYSIMPCKAHARAWQASLGLRGTFDVALVAFVEKIVCIDRSRCGLTSKVMK